MRDNFDLKAYLRHGNKLLREAVETNQFSVDLDTANYRQVMPYLKSNGIKAKVITSKGPAGGHPLIRYTASKEALKGLIDNFWAPEGSGHSAKAWYRGIKPVGAMKEGSEEGEEGLKINQKVNYNKKRYYVVASSSDNDLEPEDVAKEIPGFDPNDFVVLSLKDPTAFYGENLSTNDLIANKDAFLIKKESEIQAVSENSSEEDKIS